MNVGATYQIRSSRKGEFTGRLLHHCETWATFEITDGRAKAMLDYNIRDKGEEVTVRKSFCTFVEIEAALDAVRGE